jgi:hypothetical protein
VVEKKDRKYTRIAASRLKGSQVAELGGVGVETISRPEEAELGSCFNRLA